MNDAYDYNNDDGTYADVDDDDEDDAAALDTLLYPTPLPRADFLAPHFDPVEYLAALPNRHQTLEDLRAELRARSQQLSAELLDFVHAHQHDFLALGSLGARLHGPEGEGGHKQHAQRRRYGGQGDGSIGEEKVGKEKRDEEAGGRVEERVEELTLGLLSFRKELEAVRGAVAQRERAVKRLLDERCALRGALRVGKRLLELDGLIEDLEVKLAIAQPSVGEKDDGDDADDNVGNDVVLIDSDSESEEDEDEEEEEEAAGADDSGRDNITGGAGADRPSTVPAAAYVSSRRLQRRVQEYRCILHAKATIGADRHPFVAAQEARLARIRNTLLLDLGAALKQAAAEKGIRRDKSRLVTLLGLYSDIDAAGEAVRILKTRRGGG
jgi:hypothetical protein